MNIEIVKAHGLLNSHPYNVVVDGVVWATVHRESRSRYGMRYWFAHADKINGAIRNAKGSVYVWSSSKKAYRGEDTSPKTLGVRLQATAELLIGEGLLLSPDTRKARFDAEHRCYQEACRRAEKARMQKLRERAANFLDRIGIIATKEIDLVDALAKEFAAVIDAAI